MPAPRSPKRRASRARTAPARRSRRAANATPGAPDWNGVAAALLFDLAAVQTARGAELGYRGAAHAVRELPHPLDDPGAGTIAIPHVGPSSMRVVREVLALGASPTVEKAVATSPARDEVERSRALRENFLSRSRALEILADPRRGGVGRADYRGDLQMHSTWSDGAQTLAAICDVAIGRGYEYCAITDHFALPIARGLSPAKVERQRREIASLNRKHGGRFRLLQGIEANILADGTIDMPLADRRRVEIVVAAPHSGLRSEKEQTSRMVAAVHAPAVHILGHPRGRKYGTRPGVAADWDEVFTAAAASGIAIELDGDPDRQDLDFDLARRALRAGCLFAVDSDAHAGDELAYSEISLAQARLAGIPADRIINCWPLSRLLEWAGRRSAAG